MANKFWEKFNQGLETGNKIWAAQADRALKEELAAAGRLTPEQQTLGLNRPAEGAVPTGYEDQLMVDTQSGRFMPTADVNVDPELNAQQGIMAERFNAPNAFQGAKTTYSMGGLTQDKSFTPAEIQSARRQAMGDVYTKFGMVDKADEMALRGMQAESAGLTLKEQKKKVANEEAYEADRNQFTKESELALNAMEEAKTALQRGDRLGAAKAVASWRTLIGDNTMINITPEGQIEGSEDGGKTWKMSSRGKDGANNVFNPGTVEDMIANIDASINDRGQRLFAKHANKNEWYQMVKDTKDEALKNKTFNENIRQFGITTDLKREELNKQVEDAQRKYNLSVKELEQKGLLTKAQVLAYQASANESNAKAGYYGMGSKDMLFNERGEGYTVKRNPQTGGLSVVPITTPSGEPFVGSKKLVGGASMDPLEKIKFDRFSATIQANPDLYADEQSRADLAREFGIDPDDPRLMINSRSSTYNNVNPTAKKGLQGSGSTIVDKINRPQS